MLEKISAEVKRKVKKLVFGKNQRGVRLIEWDFLQAQCPAWIELEVKEAFEKEGKVHKLFAEQTRGIIGDKAKKDEREGKIEFTLA